MKLAVFSTKPYDRKFIEEKNRDFGHEIHFFESRLTMETVSLAAGFPAVCGFVNDVFDREVLEALKLDGVKVIALRSAGFNNVDVPAARELGICVARVPAYSPYAVAEHAVALMLALNRKIHRAHSRVRENNFALEGLMGFDMHGKTVGIVGTGKIGEVAARILHGFGCRILAFDIRRNAELESLGVEYAGLDELFAGSDVITLHAPLTPKTYHLIDSSAIGKMKPGVMIVNTSRGAMVDARAAIDALKSGHIGSLGLDVYEEEADLFFEDLSSHVLQDDVLARLLTFPNVIITGHQGYFTREALSNIARVTLDNVAAFEKQGTCQNALPSD